MSWVKWLENRRLVTARGDETVAQAIERMVERRVGSILVVEGETLKGIFSERDVLRRVLAKDRDPKTTRVDEVCTRDPHVVTEDASLADCAQLIKRHGVRHVPVVDAARRPVGMISVHDFLHYALDGLESSIEQAYREKRSEQLTDPYSFGNDSG